MEMRNSPPYIIGLYRYKEANIMKKLSLEDKTDAQLACMGVKAHITYLKQLDGCYYSYITVATRKPVRYVHLDVAISNVYLAASVKHLTGAAVDRLMIKRFEEWLGAGVSPCHTTDNFSRKMGRTIAKGRLMEIMRVEECLLSAARIIDRYQKI